MTNMYYEKDPSSAHDIHEIGVTLLGTPMIFLTDAGVFSKRTVDYGSQVLLNALNLETERTLLDVGCGYGPLGLTLNKVLSLKVTMVDINNRAINLAKQNMEKNQAKAEIFQSNLYENVTSSFDYIISNPPIRAGKKVVHEVISGAYAHLKPQGRLTIVIQKKQGAPSAKVKMEEIFGNCQIIKKDKGYYILESVKYESS